MRHVLSLERLNFIIWEPWVVCFTHTTLAPCVGVNQEIITQNGTYTSLA